MSLLLWFLVQLTRLGSHSWVRSSIGRRSAVILVPNLRVAPAIVFYLSYPIGLVYFAVTPGLRAGTAVNTLIPALLFGALAYATYDLTNYATLRHWTLQITVLDVIYGALASAAAAIAAYAIIRVSFGIPSAL